MLQGREKHIGDQFGNILIPNCNRGRTCAAIPEWDVNNYQHTFSIRNKDLGHTRCKPLGLLEAQLKGNQIWQTMEWNDEQHLQPEAHWVTGTAVCLHKRHSQEDRPMGIMEEQLPLHGGYRAPPLKWHQWKVGLKRPWRRQEIWIQMLVKVQQGLMGMKIK